jgi:hypothetical protein
LAHGGDAGEIRVLRSGDMRTWEQVAVFSTLGDDRDAHFAELDGRLFVVMGTWDFRHDNGHGLPSLSEVRGYIAWTADGETWSRLRGIYYPGWWPWRIRAHDGALYSIAYTAIRPKPSVRENRLIRSRDGVTWEYLSTITGKFEAGEGDMLFHGGGQVTAIIRTNDKKGVLVCTTNEDATGWDVRRASTDIHSPAIACWGDRVFVAGRGIDPDKAWRTRLWEFRDGEFTELLTLPSGGDTAYPGLIPAPDAVAGGPPTFYVSWYSQHEKGERPGDSDHASNIYVGRIVVE